MNIILGTIVSSQSISMAFITFTAGILSDRFAAKHLLCFGLFLCGISTLLFSMSSTVTQFSIIWFFNGLGQGFSLPSILKLTKDNSQPTSFATNWSVVLISVNFAGVMNPFLSAFIAQTYHWRTSLVFSALFTLGVGSLCYLMLETTDKKSAETVQNGKKKGGQTSSPEYSTSELLRYPMLWVCIICRFIVAVTRLSVSDWSPLYLINEKGVDVYLSSTFVSLIEIGGIFGKLIAGRISDWLMKRAMKSKNSDGSAKLMARIPVSIAMLALNGLALHLYCFHINSQTSFSMLALTALLIGVNTSGNVVNLSVIATEISPNKSGLCSSLVNLAAKGISLLSELLVFIKFYSFLTVGGIFTGLPLSLIAGASSWGTAFALIEMFCILCVCLQLVTIRMSSKLKIN